MLRIAVIAAFAGACASARPKCPDTPPVTTNAAAIEQARQDSTRYPYTEADVQFVTHMIPHHAQAIKVAKWAATHGASAAVQRLAERIVNAQQDEIVLMQQWLLDRRRPLPDTAHAHHMSMPGMLTEDQLRQLNAARGTEFDRLFLTLMIQHHRGAVEMVKQLLLSQGAAQDLFVFKFSNDVQVDQSTEVARMEQMLANLPNSQREDHE